jgi:very-short-patch-repair endonuclease
MGLPRQVLSAMAARHGLATAASLAAGGLTGDQVQGLLARGHLEAVQRGVYRLAGAAVTPEQPLLAAVLRAGPHARVGGEAALWLYGVEGAQPGARPVVLVPSGRVVRGVDFPTLRTEVPPRDSVLLRGVPTVRIERAVLEVARSADDRRVRQIVDSSRWRGHLRMDRLLRRAGELPRHPGARRVLALHAAGDMDQESAGERRLRDVLGPLAPAFRWGADDVVPGVRLDAYDDIAAVALEFDGERHHVADADIDADRTRELRIRAAGIEVVRVTWAMLRDQPLVTYRRIAAVRARRLGRG